MVKNLNQIQKYRIALAVSESINRETGSMSQAQWNAISLKYNKTERTMKRVYSQYLQEKADNVEDEIMLKPKKKQRKTIQCTEDVASTIENSILNHNGDVTYQEIQEDLEEAGHQRALSTVFKYCKILFVQAQSSYVKPSLTEEQRMKRLRFILEKIDVSDPQNLKYYEQDNIVHVDEKFFYTTPPRKNLKFLPDHAHNPQHTMQHKSHIPKLMITSAISQPTDNFDGKCGIIYQGDIIPAPRASRNRPRGTLVLQPKSVDSEEFQNGQLKEDGIINQIIEKKSPENFTTIQIDNAPGHVGNHSLEQLNLNCYMEDLQIMYTTQPPQSPDFNVNDLCIFNSLQKRTYKLRRESNHNILDLWQKVSQIYNEYPKDTIAIGYGHLFACFNETLKIMGDNRYKSPHSQVRKKYYQNQPLNRVCISILRYHELRAMVNTFFGDNE
jgi:hypothetical protein